MRVILMSQHAPDGSNYVNLTVGRIYEVLGIEGNYYRILNDRDEPILFDPVCFQVVDSQEPSNWISSIIEDARYAYPPGWGVPGYFEAWHERNAPVRRSFLDALEQWHPETFKERGLRSPRFRRPPS